MITSPKNFVTCGTILLTILLVGSHVAAQSVDVHGHITGVNAEGKPLGAIAGAEAIFLDSNNVKLGSARSDDDGYYRIEGLPSGEITYEIQASGYQAEEAERGIRVRPNLAIQVLDFRLFQGGEDGPNANGIVAVKVQTKLDRILTPATDAKVQARESDTGKIVSADFDESSSHPFKLNLRPGRWQVSATIPDQPPIVHASLLTVESGQETDIEINFTSSTTESVSPAFALVSVQKTAKRMPDANPEVNFFSADSKSDPLPASLIPVSDEELEFLVTSDDGNSPANWDWYWAESHGPLPIGDYYARAVIAGVQPVSSGTKTVDGQQTTIFHLTLQPQDQLGRLSGVVAHQISDQAKQPLVGWDVIAVNQITSESRKSTTDRRGKYELSLPDAAWWVHAQPVGESEIQISQTKPVAVEITSGGEFEHDITIAQASSTEMESGHFAIVGVQGNSTAIPQVQFISENSDPSDPVDGNTVKLADTELEEFGITSNALGDGEWQWFTSTPQQELKVGQFTASATLAEYGTRLSTPQQIVENESTFFHVTMLKPKSPGSIKGQVVQAGTDPAEIITGAEIEVWMNDSDRQRMFAEHGTFKIAAADPGVWWATASAEGFDSARALPVEVKEGEESLLDIVLTPQIVAPLTTSVVAVIGVEKESELPNVEFVAETGSRMATTAADVQPLGLAQAQQLVGEFNVDPSWNYFLGKPASELTPGRYYVTASEPAHQTDRSPTQNVLAGFDTVLEVSLFEKPIVDPQDNTAIHGRVYGQDELGNHLGMVAHAEIELRDDSTNLVVGTAVTDINGYYLIESLQPGRLNYRLSASGYQTEVAGRAIDVVPSFRPQVVDFTVTRGSELPGTIADLQVGVWFENEAGNLERINHALVTIAGAQDPENRKIFPVPAERDYQMSVMPSVYTLSATAAGFVDSFPFPIRIQANQNVKQKIILQPMVGEVRVLVSVEREQSAAPRLPDVLLRSVFDEFNTPASLEPVDEGELASLQQMVDSDGITRDWYWGMLDQSLSAAEYFAEASLEGYEMAKSSIKYLQPSETHVFQVTMTLPARTYKLSGSVVGISSQQVRSPLANSVIDFENPQSGDWQRAVTDDSGQYSVVLQPAGYWWATVTPPALNPGYQFLRPQQILIPQDQNTQKDFELKQLTPEVPPPSLRPMVTALVGVAKRDATTGAPDVSFINQHETIYSANSVPMEADELASYGLATTAENWSWYVAERVMPTGWARSEAKLSGYVSDVSGWRRIQNGETTGYFLLLRPKETQQFGSLVVNVFEKGFENEKFVDSARVEIWRGSEETSQLTAWNGVAGPEKLAADNWWVKAHADGYQSSSPTPVKISDAAEPVVVNLVLERLKKRKPFRPSKPVFALITVVDSACNAIVQPTAEFVPIGSDEAPVPARLQLVQEDSNLRIYKARPRRKLKQGRWQMVANAEGEQRVSDTRVVNPVSPTVFEVSFVRMRQFPVPVTFRVWPKGSEGDANATELRGLLKQRDRFLTTTSFPRTPEQTAEIERLDSEINKLESKSLTDVQIFLRNEESQTTENLGRSFVSGWNMVPQGDYLAIASAAGYVTSEPIPVSIGCECHMQIDLQLKPDPNQPVEINQANLYALVGVMVQDQGELREPGEEKPPQEADPIRYYLPFIQNPAKSLISLTIQSAPVRQGPSVYFIPMRPAAEQPGRIKAVVSEISGQQLNVFLQRHEQFSEFNAVKDAWQRNWYLAESPTPVPLGTYHAEAELQNFVKATSSPKEATKLVDPVFQLTLSPAAQPSGTLEVLVAVNKPVPSSTIAKPTIVAEIEHEVDYAETLEQMYTVMVPVCNFNRLENIAETRSRTVAVMKTRQGTTSLPIENVTQLSLTQLDQRGISIVEFPADQWTWFNGVANKDVPLKGKVTAKVNVEGYTPAQSSTRSLLGSSKTVLDVVIKPTRPRLLLTLQDEQTNQPIAKANLSIWNPALGQSFSNAIKSQSDESGNLQVDLPKVGTYNVLATADGFKPRSDSFTVEQANINKTILLASKTSGMTFFVGKVVEASEKNKPIEGASIEMVSLGKADAEIGPADSDPQGRFRHDQLPAGKYEVNVKAEGFTTWTGSVSVSTGVEPTEFALQPRNADLENALCLLLTKGWEKPETADRYFQRALKADASNPIVEYAMGLVFAKQQKLDPAAAQFGNAIRKRSDQFVWDRAADARFWVDMNSKDLNRATREMKSIARIYKTRPVNHASIETSRLIGISIGLAEDPWESELPAGAGLETHQAIEQNLTAEHRSAFRNGFNLVPRNGKSNDDSGNKTDPNRVKEKLKELRNQINEIDTRLKNRKNEAQNLIDGYQSQIDRIRQEFNPKQEQLDLLLLDRETKTSQLKQLQNQNAGSSKEATDLSHEIIGMGLEISQLKKAKTVVETEIQTMTRKRDGVKNDYDDFSNDRIDESRPIRDEIDALENPSNPGPVDPGASFASFRDLPLEQRRQELLDLIAPCDIEEPLLADEDPDPPEED